MHLRRGVGVRWGGRRRRRPGHGTGHRDRAVHFTPAVNLAVVVVCSSAIEGHWGGGAPPSDVAAVEVWRVGAGAGSISGTNRGARTRVAADDGVGDRASIGTRTRGGVVGPGHGVTAICRHHFREITVGAALTPDICCAPRPRLSAGVDGHAMTGGHRLTGRRRRGNRRPCQDQAGADPRQPCRATYKAPAQVPAARSHQ